MKTMKQFSLLKNYSHIKSGFNGFMNTLCGKMENNILSHPSFKGKVVFGPVHSRRLGSSLGINNIKHKICSYDCIYCQAGKTICCSTERDCCLSPYELYFFVKDRIEELEKNHISIDYISFVPNGEPTLDDLLSTSITLLREFGYKIAVFTNGSNLWNDRVKETLMFADYVSIKIDTVNEDTWKVLNRPHPRLKFDLILEGISDFSQSFNGVLATETMFVNTINDNVEEIHRLGKYLTTIKRNVSYFTTPVRPPSESYAIPPTPSVLNTLSSYIKVHIPQSELLCCPENEDFTTIGNVEEELLGIMSVQPLSEESVDNHMTQLGGDNHSVERLLQQGLIRKRLFQDKLFYVSAHK